MAKPKSTTLNIVGPVGEFPQVKLIAPTTSEYILLGLEIDHRPPIGFFIESGRKRMVLRTLKAAASEFQSVSGVIGATLFKTLISSPGGGTYLNANPEIPIAKYDVVLLIELTDRDVLDAFVRSEMWKLAESFAKENSRKTLMHTAVNFRRIGAVDHSRGGVFLFNFFAADSLEQNLAVWEYTAGWFTDQTGLDNSTLLVPDPDENSDYTVINHCRWDHLWDIMPSLLFKRSFKDYVIRNFDANQTGPVPILYRLAWV